MIKKLHFLTAALVLVAMTARAQDETLTWLKNSMAHAATLSSFQVEYVLTMATPGAPEMKLPGKIILRGTTDMYVELGEGENLVHTYTRGSETSLHVPNADRYMTMPIARTEMLKNLGSQASNLVFVWLAGYFGNDPKIVSDITASEFIGQTEVATRPARRLRVKYQNYDMDIWLAQDDAAPSILKLVLSFPNSDSDTPTVTFTFDKIQENQAIEDKVFAYTPGEKTRLVESPDELFAPKENVQIGQNAPDFSLPKLGGGTVSLADHKGKDIVLLDFFASWCGPCRMGMPVIDALAAEYAGKGVAFYAVNLREAEAKAKTFIETNNIKNLGVLIDLSGEVGGSYDASSIPRTVIIDKEGVVQAIHRGFSPNLKDELKKDLDSILKGAKTE